MTLKEKKSRRDFLKTSSLAAAGFFIVPRHVLGRGFVAPSDKLNIAGVGVGGRAETNLPKAWNNGSDNITALCDVDDRMSVKARARWPGASYYKDYRVMLEKEGKNPFILDSKEPDWSKFQDFLRTEVRYTSLLKAFPAEAEILFKASEENAKWRYKSYQRLAAMEFSPAEEQKAE